MYSKRCIVINTMRFTSLRLTVGAHNCTPSPATNVVYSKQIYAHRHMKLLGFAYARAREIESYARSGAMRALGLDTHYARDYRTFKHKWIALQGRKMLDDVHSYLVPQPTSPRPLAQQVAQPLAQPPPLRRQPSNERSHVEQHLGAVAYLHRCHASTPRLQQDFSTNRLASRYPSHCRAAWAGRADGGGGGNRWFDQLIVASAQSRTTADTARGLLMQSRARDCPRAIQGGSNGGSNGGGSSRLGAALDSDLRTLAREYVLPLRWSGHAGCRLSPVSDCFVQVPKVGSTSLKILLGLMDPCTMQLVTRAPHHKQTKPSGLASAKSSETSTSSAATSSALDAADEGWLPCGRMILPVRDPVLRFLSGMGTVYARSQATLSRSRPNCSMAADASGPAKGAGATGGVAAEDDAQLDACVWGPLDTLQAFERYGYRLLALVERSLAECAPSGIGHTAFQSDVARHLLPQTVFAATAPPGAVLYATDVEGFQEGARRLRLLPHACGGTPAACLMNNSQEGSRGMWALHRPDPSLLSSHFRARIEEVFSMDFELLRLLTSQKE